MKPYVQLTGEDGNAFSIIGRVSNVLKSAGLVEQANDFKEKAFRCSSFNELLNLVPDYCEVG
ncbi:hypothetical protein ACFQZE_06640 [Paenibacillus sp. GCM10027627]|uniref:hypothetical protein n=1 Tax=unclassified Paenibacillus TaxID=185978 RepID=UPI003642934E